MEPPVSDVILRRIRRELAVKLDCAALGIPYPPPPPMPPSPPLFCRRRPATFNIVHIIV